eukprot:3491402-Pyramimonas_sp.AAC.1
MPDLAQLGRRRGLADLDRPLRYGGVSLPKPKSPKGSTLGARDGLWPASDASTSPIMWCSAPSLRSGCSSSNSPPTPTTEGACPPRR